MASKKKARARAAAAIRFTKASPLIVLGTCWSEEQHERFVRVFVPVLSFLVECVPWFRSSQRGRSSERQMRVTIMLCGLALAVLSGSMLLALLGGVIAMVGTVIPVPEGRKIRWRKQVAALRDPVTIRIPNQVEVCFDGDSIALIQNGVRIRQVRIAENQGRAHLHRVDARVALEFRPKSGGRNAKIWLVSEADEALERQLTDLTTQNPKHLSMPVTLSSEDWEQVRCGVGM